MALTAYQAHMKRELKGKMKGKTAAQRKAIFKAAAASYKAPRASRVAKAVARVRSARAPRIQTSSKSGGNHTGKGGFNTAKLFKVVRMASLVMPAATEVFSSASPQVKMIRIVDAYTGYDMGTGTFHFDHLAKGYLPFIATSVVTAFIPKLTHLIRGIM